MGTARKKAQVLAISARDVRVQRFVWEYLKDLNGTRAYQRVYGCSLAAASAAASRMLRDVKVRRAIETAQGELEERTKINVQRVIEAFARIAFADITLVAEWNRRDGVKLVESKDLPPDVSAGIAEVVQGKDGVRVKMHDKLAALNGLARYFGMLKDQVRVTGVDDEPLIPLEFVRKLMALAERDTEGAARGDDSSPALSTH
jgi:phage terminase small subunit